MADHEHDLVAEYHERSQTVVASIHAAFEWAERGQRFHAKLAETQGHREHMSPAHWLRDFCTVRLNIGRGAGHTPLITRRAEPGDVILVANPLLHRRMLEVAARLKRGIGEFDDFARLSHRIDLRGARIWVDDPTLTLPTERHRCELYELAAAMKAPQVFMVGT